MVYIFYTYLDAAQHENLLLKYASNFSATFQERLSKFRRWQNQQASLLGRVLLGIGLKQLYDCNLPDSTFGKYGKPYFKNSNIEFNISHSHHLVVCAITKNNAIGIDVEYQKPIDIQGLKFQMTEKEWLWVSRAEDSTTAFYEYWTKKEAVIKAIGKGFSADLKAFEVLGGTKEIFVENKDWHLQKIPIALDYECYLAANQNDKVEIQEIRPL